jgi:hypothetical protein
MQSLNTPQKSSSIIDHRAYGFLSHRKGERSCALYQAILSRLTQPNCHTHDAGSIIDEPTRRRMTMKALFTGIAVSLIMTAAVPAAAAPCRDAKGKFVKCPEKPAKKQVCKDAKGKFAKCGTPGAKPA